MKRSVICTLILIGFIAFNSVAQTGESTDSRLKWYSDLTVAYDVSQSTGKPIFAFFTGSDWCGWCHKLQKDVFAKEAFVEWAEKNVVLVELDFPRRTQLPAALAQQNNTLQQVFRVSGFPTIWMFDLSKDEVAKKFTISALGSLGYPKAPVLGSEEIKFLQDANAVLSNRKSINPKG